MARTKKLPVKVCMQCGKKLENVENVFMIVDDCYCKECFDARVVQIQYDQRQKRLNREQSNASTVSENTIRIQANAKLPNGMRFQVNKIEPLTQETNCTDERTDSSQTILEAVYRKEHK